VGLGSCGEGGGGGVDDGSEVGAMSMTGFAGFCGGRGGLGLRRWEMLSSRHVGFVKNVCMSGRLGLFSRKIE
jgi:hypothetical protein